MNLADIVSAFDPQTARRIESAIGLIARQAVGSERYRQHVESWTKDDKSPVTVADLLHQSQVQQMLADEFPGDGLISEEPRSMQEQVVEQASRVSREFYGQELRPEIADVPDSGRVTWILDPIDGTKGYLAGRYYAIAIGFFVDGAPVFGAMAVPHSPRAERTEIDNKVAFAVVGKGAWIADVAENGELGFERLDGGSGASARPWKVAVSLEHGGGVADAFKDTFAPVRMDSQAKYLGVAAGAIDAYLRKSRDDGGTDVTWDHMPGMVIAREAGCTVRSFGSGAADPKPERVIRFDGGMICHRGGRDSELATALDRLVSPE